MNVTLPRTHAEAVDVACPVCEAEAGDQCVSLWYGTTLPSQFHRDRWDRADLHEVTWTRVPESDVLVAACTECDWVDSL